MAESVQQQCQRNTCLCDDCLKRKLDALQKAEIPVQRIILQHLPHFALHPPAPPQPPTSSSAADYTPVPSLPAASPAGRPPHATSSSSSLHAGQGPSNASSSAHTPRSPHVFNESNRDHALHQLSMFSTPLFPLSSIEEFDPLDDPSHQPGSGLYVGSIPIPPLVLERIPDIKDYIRSVMKETKVTGPRKKAAMEESIEEILALCDKSLKGQL